MKKVVAVVTATLMVAVLMTGCTESEQVSYNIGRSDFPDLCSSYWCRQRR